ncbi:MAG: hypothetical protein R2824_19600 [Saprospiraceae bacterium]|nr:hypothetical protein [Lewinella sp.]
MVEESDETVFWLELFQECRPDEMNKLTRFYDEALEILKVMAVIRKNLKSK